MKRKTIIIVLVALAVLYFIYKFLSRTKLGGSCQSTCGGVKNEDYDPSMPVSDTNKPCFCPEQCPPGQIPSITTGGCMPENVFNTGIMELRGSNPQSAKFKSMTSGKCVTPQFKAEDLNGRWCAGMEINENRTLRIGDQSCEVLLLQQRLNAMQSEKYVLKPNGKFCCKTKFKLNLLMGVPQISLNRFSPDEQIGFNELEGGNKITPYSYMDLNTKRK